MIRSALLLATGLTAVGMSSALGAPGEFFPVAEAVPGTKAVARTVFRGDEIEEFPLEIIGIFPNFSGPGQDILLARLLGDRTAFTGVASGMSGSPVYVDGRLLGALSYRVGSFVKEPIAGITPIEAMLRAGQIPAASRPRPGRDVAALPGPDSAFVPIETPLLLGGFARSVVDAWTPRLRGLGLDPVQAGAGGAGGAGEGDAKDAALAGPLRPGSPIAAVLVRGDMTVAAAGTLTHIEGDRLYAFGHPFLQAGSVSLPAARAQVLWTLSSWQGSNKIITVGKTVGTFQEDRLTAVVGQLGPGPGMIPVNLTIEAEGRPSRSQSFEIARLPSLVPLLAHLTVANALENSLDFSYESTVFLSGDIAVPGHAPIPIEDVFPGDASLNVASAAATRLATLVQKLYANPFREPEMTAVSLRVRQVPSVRLATIDRVSLSSEQIRPGVPFEVRVHLRQRYGERTIETATLVLPPGTLPGETTLIVGEGKEVEGAAPSASPAGRLGAVRDYTGWLDRLSEESRGGSLYLRLVRTARGVTIRGETLPDLPPSVLSLLSARRGGEQPVALEGRVLWEEVRQLAAPVSGIRSVAIRIAGPG